MKILKRFIHRINNQPSELYSIVCFIGWITFLSCGFLIPKMENLLWLIAIFSLFTGLIVNERKKFRERKKIQEQTNTEVMCRLLNNRMKDITATVNGFNIAISNIEFRNDCCIISYVEPQVGIGDVFIKKIGEKYEIECVPEIKEKRAMFLIACCASIYFFRSDPEVRE